MVRERCINLTISMRLALIELIMELQVGCFCLVWYIPDSMAKLVIIPRDFT